MLHSLCMPFSFLYPSNVYIWTLDIVLGFKEGLVNFSVNMYIHLCHHFFFFSLVLYFIFYVFCLINLFFNSTWNAVKFQVYYFLLEFIFGDSYILLFSSIRFIYYFYHFCLCSYCWLFLSWFCIIVFCLFIYLFFFGMRYIHCTLLSVGFCCILWYSLILKSILINCLKISLNF